MVNWKKMWRAILSFVVALAAFPAIASEPDFVTAIWYARDLQKLCGADPKAASGEYGMCWSFIGAVPEVVNNDSIYELKACVPPLTNAQKAVRLTIKWLDDHPDSDIKAASLVTTEALADAFPCKDSN